MPKPPSLFPERAGHQTQDPPPPGTPEHLEWLIDTGAEQTFPASDPPSTMDPGDTLTMNNNVRTAHETPRPKTRKTQ